MTSKEFRDKLNGVSSIELYDKMEQVLNEFGLTDIKVTGFEVTPRVEITDRAECEAAGGEWVCRDRNNSDINARCRCQGL